MKPNEKPRYFTQLPANIRYNANLAPLTRIIYSEIQLLTEKYGYSNVKNETLADWYSVNIRTITRCIKELWSHNLIRIEQSQHRMVTGQMVTDRKIYLTNSNKKPIDKNVHPNFNQPENENLPIDIFVQTDSNPSKNENLPIDIFVSKPDTDRHFCPTTDGHFCPAPIDKNVLYSNTSKKNIQGNDYYKANPEFNTLIDLMVNTVYLKHKHRCSNKLVEFHQGLVDGSNAIVMDYMGKGILLDDLQNQLTKKIDGEFRTDYLSMANKVGKACKN